MAPRPDALWAWRERRRLGAATAAAPQGMYLVGSVGTGKTLLMDTFLASLREERRAAGDSQLRTRRVHFHTFMLDVHERIHRWRLAREHVGDGPSDPIEPVARQLAAEAAVLCFDEFQVTDVADALLMRRLFGYLWAHGTVVVATSNRLPRDLYENGINRFLFLPFVELLESRCEVLQVGSETERVDYRLRDLGEEQEEGGAGGAGGGSGGSFFYPLAEAGPLMRRSFDERCAVGGGGGRSEPGPAEVKVMMGRTLVLRRACPPARVAWLSFAELCEQPLSSADYTALVRSFHTIYVSDVPELGAQGHDSARRLITFVDLAYEFEVLCFMSGAKPLDRLFQVSSDPTILGGRAAAAAAPPPEIAIREEGGSSSSGLTTFIKTDVGEVEWSATGRSGASLADLTGVRDTGFAAHRCISRLMEMGTKAWAERHRRRHLAVKRGAAAAGGRRHS